MSTDYTYRYSDVLDAHKSVILGEALRNDPDATEAVEEYARAAEDEYAAIELHNLAAKASGDYDRAMYGAIEDGEPSATEASRRALRATQLAAEVRAAKSAEERRTGVRLAEMAGAGRVTEDAIRAVYGVDRFGYQRAARMALAAVAD